MVEHLLAKCTHPLLRAIECLQLFLAETIIDKTAADALKSNNRVCHRMDDMGIDVVDQVVENLNYYFSLQLDKLTDVSGEA